MFQTFYQISVLIVIFYTIFGWVVVSNLIPLNYGRLKQSLTQIEIPAKIAWFIFQVPNLFWIFYFVLYKGMELNLGISLFGLHYINRDIIYPLRLKSDTKVPFQIMVTAFSFTLGNGYLQCYMNLKIYEKYQLLQILGVIIFFIGMYINIKSDEILRGKQNTTQKDKRKKYVRIDEFLFKYVSSPNYFGEIVEWFGYFLVTQQLEGFMFLFSTLNILTAAAIKRHRWNLKHIHNYPTDRKIIIPYIL